jgi:hypothetical protein
MLQHAIEAQRGVLRSATAAEIASACEALVTHAAVTGINIPDGANLVAVWAAHCRDMPASLLATGLAEVLKHWTNTFCLPAPGAVWEEVTPALLRMRSDLGAMERALAMTAQADLDPDDRQPSEDTERLLAETKAMLKSAGGSFRRIA